MGTDLSGQVAIVTGASSGLGHAVAKALAKRGAKLVLTARREELLLKLRQKLAQLGGEAISVAGDGAHEATVQAVVRSALNAFGTIDILINNAGAGFYKPFLETSVNEFDGLVNSNLRSSFLFTRHVLPSMVERESGVVLFVSSVAGLAGPANEAVYAATKFAQTGLAQSLDAEFRSHGIKVGVIHPGGMKTEFAIGHGRDAASVASSHMMEPDEVAELIAFTCTLPRNIRIPQMIVRHMG
jgi:3-oxoacyl-[acyl-carrier protein] reductase